MTGDGNVQFTIELPGNVDSRAISDGLTATKLQIAVYKEDGTLLENVSRIGENAVTMSGKKATVNFKLVKGLKYSFAFWAQNPGCEAYAFDAATGKVTVDYSKALANVDDGDAFSNTATLKVTGPMNETIYLYRPFAQLNYGDVLEDYAAATAAGIDFKQTAVTVKQVATSFDIMNKTTSGDNLVDVTWPAANSAIANETLTVEDVDYKWLSMCYFLVPNDESTVTTELSLLNTAGTAFNTIKVNNVPVQKNHRTNILGNLFTDDVNFNVIIDQNFDTPDYNVEPVNPILVSTEDELKTALNKEDKNIYIKLLNDVQLSYGARVAYGNANTESITIDGDGHTLNLKGTDTDWSSFGAWNGNLILKNMTVNKTEEGNGAWNNHAINLSNRNGNGSNVLTSGKIYLQNVTFNNAVCIQNDAEIENCNFIEPGAYYVFYINANVKNTTINNCTFSAKLTTGDKGRGIKVNDQYVDAADRVQCNINISNCSFETMKKAAILVTNTAGAKITASNLDISKVAADNINAVWNDSDRKDAWDLVVVSGCTKKQE